MTTIVYRVVGGYSFGSGFGGDYTEIAKFKAGTLLKDSALFVTPHRDCVKNMVDHCDAVAFQAEGLSSWARVAVIEATILRDVRPEEKVSHHDGFDRDEMILVEGKVLQLFALDSRNGYKFPDEVAVNA